MEYVGCLPQPSSIKVNVKEWATIAMLYELNVTLFSAKQFDRREWGRKKQLLEIGGEVVLPQKYILSSWEVVLFSNALSQKNMHPQINQ